MGKSDPPAPPDPQETSAAQTGTNVATAIANSQLGMVDQYTPYGSLTYSQKRTEGGSAPRIERIPGTTAPMGGFGGFGDEGTSNDPFGFTGTGTETTADRFRVGGETFDSRKAARQYRTGLMEGGAPQTYTFTDPYTGKSYEIPQFESRIELTPQQQATLDASQAAQGNLASLAEDRSDFLLGYLPDTEAITDQIDSKLYDLGAKRLDPRFEQEREALRTQLVNQGINIGSEAYDREMGRLNESKNDAYNQLVLQGRGTALNEVNQPINQIIGLLSGTQVQNPNVQMQQPAQIPTTDNAGIIMDNYRTQLANWNQQQSQRQGMMGGLFGAGATLLGAPSGSVFGSLFA